MKYKCIRGVVTSQGPLNAGDITTLPHGEALALLAGKKIEIFEEAVRVADAPAIEHRDPVVKRGSKNGR